MVRSAEDEEGDSESGFVISVLAPNGFSSDGLCSMDPPPPPLVSKGFSIPPSTPDQGLDSPKIGRRKG